MIQTCQTGSFWDNFGPNHAGSPNLYQNCLKMTLGQRVLAMTFKVKIVTMNNDKFSLDIIHDTVSQ